MGNPMRKLYENEEAVYCELFYASRFSVEEVAKVATTMTKHFKDMGFPTTKSGPEAKCARATIWLGQALLSYSLKKCWCSHYEGVKY